MASIKLEIGSGEIVTAMITKESVEKLDLEVGDDYMR